MDGWRDIKIDGWIEKIDGWLDGQKKNMKKYMDG